MPNDRDVAPGIIGCTGGSGSRVIARIVRDAGMFIGANRNDAEDALDLVAFLDRWVSAYAQRDRMPLAPPMQQQMVSEFQTFVRTHRQPLGGEPRPWGWKAPRTLFVLPFLHEQFPAMRFCHLTRDGRDMAFSANQNQLAKHGDAVLGGSNATSAVRSIELWSRVNLEAARYGRERLGDRYLHVRFEDLCRDATASVTKLLEFFELEGNAATLAQRHVAAPASLGRWRDQDPALLRQLHKTAGEALAAFGYE